MTGGLDTCILNFMFSKKKKWNIKKSDPKEKLKIPKRVWVYMILGLVCVLGIIYVLRLPEYKVQNVTIKNAVVTKDADIKQIADEYLSYYYFYIIPQSNVWLYPKNNIEDAIRKIPSIQDVDITLGQDHLLTITVIEKDNKYIWCSNTNDCYYMNGAGYIFANAPIFEGNLFTLFRGPITGVAPDAYFLDPQKMSSLINFINEARDIGTIVAVDVKSKEETDILFGSGAKIIISLENDLKKTYINLKTLINSKDFNQLSGGIDSVQYIDLRYGKKAFWK